VLVIKTILRILVLPAVCAATYFVVVGEVDWGAATVALVVSAAVIVYDEVKQRPRA